MIIERMRIGYKYETSTRFLVCGWCMYLGGHKSLKILKKSTKGQTEKYKKICILLGARVSENKDYLIFKCDSCLHLTMVFKFLRYDRYQGESNPHDTFLELVKHIDVQGALLLLHFISIHTYSLYWDLCPSILTTQDTWDVPTPIISDKWNNKYNWRGKQSNLLFNNRLVKLADATAIKKLVNNKKYIDAYKILIKLSGNPEGTVDTLPSNVEDNAVSPIIRSDVEHAKEYP